MAWTGATVETFENVWPHGNADRLDLAILEGMSLQFVVGRGSYKVGDKCIYIPTESVLPDELATLLGLQKRRIKTVKLRGEISQGVVGPLSLLNGLSEPWTAERVTEHLGITKYETPDETLDRKPIYDANLLPLPLGLSVYDIESADRHKRLVHNLMQSIVVIHEKLEGQNFSVAVTSDGEVWLNQRRFSVRPKSDTNEADQPHVFWSTAHRLGLVDKARAALADIGAGWLVLYGEMLGPGIQGNIYRLPEHQVRFFDALVDDTWLDAVAFGPLCAKHGLATAPVLSHGVSLAEALDGQSVNSYATGQSALAMVLREGIVIRPATEQYANKMPQGRLILKQRSAEYLARQK